MRSHRNQFSCRQNEQTSALPITDPEVRALIGDSTFGTKLSGKLGPEQMARDAEIKWSGFGSKGAGVYSNLGALTIALNVALPLAALSWLLVGACRGGWRIDERWIARWRKRWFAAAGGAGLAVYLFLPKVEVASRPALYDGGVKDTVARAARGIAAQTHCPAPIWGPA
jgi:hypothetical protein